MAEEPDHHHEQQTRGAERTGDRLDVPVTDSAKLYTVTFAVGNVESVQNAAGARVPALRITPTVREQGGTAPISGTVIWLSNDASLKPIRFESTVAVGRIVAALK